MTWSPGISFYTLILFYCLAFKYRMERSVDLKQMLILRDSLFQKFHSLKKRVYSVPSICFWLLANFKQQSGPTVCLSTVPHTETNYAESGVPYGLDYYLGPKHGQRQSHKKMLAVN